MTGILNIQVNPTFGKLEVNLKKAEHFIKKYSDKNLDLVVLPEFFATGNDYENYDKVAVDEDGGVIIEFIKDLSKKYNTNIAAGSVIEKSGINFYNTAFIVSRKGEIIGKYRKIHLFDYMGGNEREIFTPGEDIAVMDLDIGKIGIAISHDVRFPLLYKNLSKAGADIVVQPSSWVIPNEIYNDVNSLKYAQEMWIAINRTRAYDNQVYLVTANQTKTSGKGGSAIGNSLIIAPTSEVLANAKNDQCAVYAEVDIQLVKYYKSLCPIAQID